ncbi:hypothetical protein K461DRAFT_275711 [Myriangium duriaei CBS 260.36]|uniref:Secreted protein n=1 Tax=Myriangium duriaei CBS 260.36 TaxID=1168546 RepID=A0A9P4MPD7_9PEZI|nr:hypothetical protein K461DRAFT_275711 [Myriangium duriaei CBS 260.36]
MVVATQAVKSMLCLLLAPLVHASVLLGSVFLADRIALADKDFLLLCPTSATAPPGKSTPPNVSCASLLVEGYLFGVHRLGR